MKTFQIRNLRGTGAEMTCCLREQTPAIPNRMRRPAVLICPGGGYQYHSLLTSYTPAMEYLAHGYHVFILWYSLRRTPAEPPLYLTPLLQLSAAVMEIRAHGEEWGVLPEQLAVCGFSAGGHLAASLTVHWNHPRLTALQDTGSGLNRPSGAVLCYPVITAGEKAHRDSILALTGGDPEWNAFFSLERHVTPETPPCFLWHTMEDGLVPVENSLDMAAALVRAGVPAELHCYQRGGHGLGLCRQETRISGIEGRLSENWLAHSMDWLDSLFGFER